MKHTLLLLLWIFSISSAYPVYFKKVGIEDGLSQLSVISIYQDRLGRMWFGTLEGLNRYDGESIVTFKPDQEVRTENGKLYQSLPGNEVYPIVGDAVGNIFFKADRFLMKYDIRTEIFHKIRDKDVATVTSYKGEIWVAVRDSIFKWDENCQQLTFYLKTELPRLITRIMWDSNNRLWIGTAAGLYVYEQGKAISCIIPDHDIYSLYEDRDQNLWISTRMEGLYRMTPEKNLHKYLLDPGNPYTVPSNQTREFVEDNLGNLWIGTFKGLCKYDPSSQHFTTYPKDDLPGSLAHSSVFSLCKDSQGTIWVGTYYGGVNYFNPENDIYTYYAASRSRKDCLNFPFVGNMAEDDDGNIWICTEGGGLNYLNRNTRTFTHFTAAESGNTIRENNLKCIYYDRKRKKVYIGTHTGGLSIYDIKTKKFRNLLQERNPVAPHCIIQDMKVYQDKLVFLDREGLFVLDMDSEEVSPLLTHVSYAGKPYAGLNFMIDSKGFVWLTKTGRIVRINLKTGSEEVFSHEKNGLGAFSALKILETSDGNIYVGTRGSGLFLYDEEKNIFKQFTAEENYLLSNYCYNIAEAGNGLLIVTGDKGISFFDPGKGMVKQVRLDSGLPITSINLDCGVLVCNDGEVFVGSAGGLVSFYEQDLYKSNKGYDLYFSDLYIHNKKVFPSDVAGVLSSSLAYADSLSLNYKQNNLIFHFASGNYIHSQKNTTYEYMLEGFDKGWIPTTKTSLHYTNLNPGKYNLKVRERDSYTGSLLRHINLKVQIHSPYYATPLAFFIYLIIVSSILYAVVRFRLSKIKLTASLETERKDKERIEEINQAKLLFFTNISHEFKTPLTLIISQIDLLLQNRTLAPQIYNQIFKAYKHAQHLRHLINELLDFRKLEQKHVRLNVMERDLIIFLKEIYIAFNEYASPRNITYSFNSEAENIPCWFDPKQLGKVFNNLLSNAFRYTNERGIIDMVVSQTDHHVIIKVIDNGIGIPARDINRIFDRFYQAGNDKEAPLGNTGTGIGLALAKNIMDLHHGTISVESSPGYGSIFTVSLQRGNAHFADDASVTTMTGIDGYKTEQAQVIPETVFTEQIVDSSETSLEQIKYEGRYTILIVEDKDDLLQVLSALFTPFYKVFLAHDGQQGLSMAKKEKPDIILSDVMMPCMTGIEMCFKIKNDLDLCHIPVVLLTAFTSPEKNIEGFQRGADDYIAKPFDSKVLLARCNNLIRNRIMLQQRLQNQTNFDIQLLANNGLDKQFLDQIETIVEKNIDNADFGVSQLTKELAMSRSLLFAKFKALIGVTPNDYILNKKLNKAARLLKTNSQLQIVEISEQLGFNSQQYFSRCFKAKFDMTPFEYRKKN